MFYACFCWLYGSERLCYSMTKHTYVFILMTFYRNRQCVERSPADSSVARRGPGAMCSRLFPGEGTVPCTIEQ